MQAVPCFGFKIKYLITHVVLASYTNTSLPNNVNNAMINTIIKRMMHYYDNCCSQCEPLKRRIKNVYKNNDCIGSRLVSSVYPIGLLLLVHKSVLLQKVGMYEMIFHF